jgi:beta-glucanase (GH16 family)
VYAEYRDVCPHGQYDNGHIGSRGKRNGDLKYGFMAARMKLQPQRGHHAGFWSQPTDAATPSGAEIDVMEYYGGTTPSARIQHSVYRGTDLQAKAFENRAYLLGRGRTFSNSYHVFSVQWTRRHYIFRIDGHETFRTRRGISRTPQYLILSLLSSDWELPNLPRRGRLEPLYVDWVRTWEQ